MGKFNKIIEEVSLLLKKGHTIGARRVLGRLRTPRKMERQERLKLAQLARRAGFHELCLRLLNPVVRPAGFTPVAFDPLEAAEYAAALIRVGAIHEGMELLGEISEQKYPVVLFYKVHGLFPQWRYAEAIPLLRAWAKHCSNDFERVICDVNLAAALVHELQFGAASELLEKLERETTRLGFTALLGNTLEKMAESAIHQRQWDRARAFLERAEKATLQSGGMDRFFVMKWTLLGHFLRNPKKNAFSLAKLRERALASRHWETLRECDFYGAVAKRDEALLWRVFFGTPYPHYRDRLLAHYEAPPKIPEFYDLSFKGMGNRETSLEFLYARPGSSRVLLKPGQLLHRLAGLLASDFYRPFTVSRVFSGVYPREHYHPVHSAQRVYQAVKCFRKWLRGNKVPIALVEDNREYSLGATGKACVLRVPNPEWWRKNRLSGIPELRRLAGHEPFTPQRAAEWLGVPRRTASYWLKQAVHAGVLVQEASRRPTRFRFSQ